jgi:hypothetical protein
MEILNLLQMKFDYLSNMLDTKMLDTTHKNDNPPASKLTLKINYYFSKCFYAGSCGLLLGNKAIAI